MCIKTINRVNFKMWIPQEDITQTSQCIFTEVSVSGYISALSHLSRAVWIDAADNVTISNLRLINLASKHSYVQAPHNTQTSALVDVWRVIDELTWTGCDVHCGSFEGSWVCQRVWPAVSDGMLPGSDSLSHTIGWQPSTLPFSPQQSARRVAAMVVPHHGETASPHMVRESGKWVRGT